MPSRKLTPAERQLRDRALVIVYQAIDEADAGNVGYARELMRQAHEILRGQPTDDASAPIAL